MNKNFLNNVNLAAASLALMNENNSNTLDDANKFILEITKGLEEEKTNYLLPKAPKNKDFAAKTKEFEKLYSLCECGSGKKFKFCCKNKS